MNLYQKVIHSRRAWTFAGTLILLIANELLDLNLKEEVIWPIVAMAAAYIGGVSIEKPRSFGQSQPTDDSAK